MKIYLLIAFTLISNFFISDVFSQTDSKQRARWIKHLRLMVGEDPKADILIETESDQIFEALKKGDPGLAREVVLASERMLDNEGLFSLLAEAILISPDAALEAFQSMKPKTRNAIIQTLPSGADSAFYNAPKDRAKFLANVREITVKLQQGSELSESKEVVAVINDPDGYTNVRAKADTSSKIVTTVKEGEQFTVLKREGDWCRVETSSGTVGYMHNSRVRIIQ